MACALFHSHRAAVYDCSGARSFVIMEEEDPSSIFWSAFVSGSHCTRGQWQHPIPQFCLYPYPVACLRRNQFRFLDLIVIQLHPCQGNATMAEKGGLSPFHMCATALRRVHGQVRNARSGSSLSEAFFPDFFIAVITPRGIGHIGPISRLHPPRVPFHDFTSAHVYTEQSFLTMQIPEHSDEIKVDFPAEHVMLLTMNRPAALNTMTPTLEADLKTLLDWFDGVPELWSDSEPFYLLSVCLSN